MALASGVVSNDLPDSAFIDNLWIQTFILFFVEHLVIIICSSFFYYCFFFLSFPREPWHCKYLSVFLRPFCLASVLYCSYALIF